MNNVGFQTAHIMNIILTRTLEDGPQTECTMICTMIMPHLLLARSKCENGALIAKTLSRMFKMLIWFWCNFDDLFVETKALQDRLKNINRKREVDEYKAFDKQMKSGKISNTLRCLSDNAKGSVVSTSDKVTIKGIKCNLLDVLQEEHPCSLQGDLK